MAVNGFKSHIQNREHRDAYLAYEEFDSEDRTKANKWMREYTGTVEEDYYAGNKDQIENLIDNLSTRFSGKSIKPKVYISTIYSDGKCISAAHMGEVMALNERLIKSNLMAFDEVYGLQQRDRCFSATPWGIYNYARWNAGQLLTQCGCRELLGHNLDL